MCKYKDKTKVMLSMKRGFTLPEMLVVMVIIGIVAALTIPSLITAYEQHQFKTGLRKAVKVLNEAILTGTSIDDETPLTNSNTFGYLMKHMSVIKTTRVTRDDNTYNNVAFYTTDGMRFEFEYLYVHYMSMRNALRLHENNNIKIKMANSATKSYYNPCGSYGLESNPSNSMMPPCYIIVDVNGDKGPSTPAVNLVFNPDKNLESGSLTDIFPIMITESGARPYGVVAQRAMYGK